MGKSNAEKKEEIKLMDELNKESNDLKEKNVIKMFDELFSDLFKTKPKSDERIGKIYEILDKFAEVPQTPNLINYMKPKMNRYELDIKIAKNKLFEQLLER